MNEEPRRIVFTLEELPACLRWFEVVRLYAPQTITDEERLMVAKMREVLVAYGSKTF